MGKKYLKTKENSLESSVLGIWQEAAKKADELEEAKFSPKEIKMAIGVASDKRYAGGNMTGAVKAIEKMKKGLSDHPQVKAVLRRQNEAKLDPVNKKALKKDFDDRKDKDIDNDGDVDSSDKYLAKRRKAVSKAISKEENELDEKKANFLRLTFNSPADVKKARKWMDQNLPGANQGFTGVDYSGKDIEFEGVDDAEDLMKQLKNTKLKFKVDHRESVNEAQSGGKEEYQKFFNAALKKFKVKSPAEFKSDEEKKKFYDYIDKNWDGDNEKAEGAMSQVREFKMAGMKAALADIWGMKEGKNPFKKEEEEEKPVITKGGKTLTGKKPAAIDVNPKIKV